MTYRNCRKGSALLISLAVLAVLSILATSFVQIQGVARDAASNAVLQSRAELAAHAGVSRAIASLQQNARPVVDLSTANWLFYSDTGTELDYAEHTALDKALFPSLAFDRDGDGTFENGVGGTSDDDLVNGRAVSGVISGVGSDGTAVGASGDHYGRQTLDPEGLVYILRIRDTSGKLNINGKQSSMAEMLDDLGKSIEDVEFYDPIAGRGDEIVALRDAQPGGVLQNLDTLIGLLTPDEVDDIRGYLTCHSWRDELTVKPIPTSDPATLPVLAAEPRHPVNINTAANVVLVTLLRDLSGYSRTIGPTTDSMSAVSAITLTQATAIADAILSARKSTPFRTYAQLRGFYEGLDVGLTTSQIDVLMANADPSARIANLHAGRARHVAVSKADLTRASTEFCFGANGIFEIEALGLVTHRGNIVGRAQQSVVVRVADVVRHMSQSDFALNSFGKTNTTSFPNHGATTSSLVDGQVSMGVPPDVVPSFTHIEYCFSITSNPEKLPTNNITTEIPDSIVDKVRESVDNNQSRNAVEAEHEPKTGIKGFKFSPGVLGGKGKVETLTYCFRIPEGSIETLRIVTKVGSPSHIVSFPLVPPPVPGTTKLDPDGFKVKFTGYKWTNEDGSSTSDGLPDRFYATYASGYDAEIGWIKTATTTRIAGVPALAGSGLMPDGTITRRSKPEELSYAAKKNLETTQGTLEFWAKLPAAPTDGTTDPLIYAVQPIENADGSAPTEGLVTRIERAGTELIATRAYVGHPSPAAGPYAYSASESTADVSSWRANEWHHIALVWFNTTDQRLYVDGVLVSDKTTSTAPNKLALNDLKDRMCVGGYTYDTSKKRYSSSTIAELKIFTLLEYSGPSFSAPERFIAHSGSTLANWTGRFNIFSYTFGARVVAISWIERGIDGWDSTTYSGSTAPDVELDYRKKGSVMWTTVPKADSSGGDGRGVVTSLVLAPYAGAVGEAVPGVDYRLRFTGTVAPLNATPAIDEVRLLIVGTPHYLSRRLH